MIKSMIAKNKGYLLQNYESKIDYEEMLSAYYIIMNFNNNELEKQEVEKEFKSFLEELYKNYRYKNLLEQKRISYYYVDSLLNNKNNEKGYNWCE